MLGDLVLAQPATRGGAGDAAAGHLTGALEPVFLRTPGVVSDRGDERAILADPYVARTMELLGRLDVAFAGVGPADTHGPLLADDNFFSTRQLRTVRDRGAVGQLVQRFIDGEGRRLTTELDNLVVGITLAQLRVVVLGGPSSPAVRASTPR